VIPFNKDVVERLFQGCIDGSGEYEKEGGLTGEEAARWKILSGKNSTYVLRCQEAGWEIPREGGGSFDYAQDKLGGGEKPRTTA
jgi:hypothetical protein